MAAGRPGEAQPSEALLARFHTACEKFFDRYAHRTIWKWRSSCAASRSAGLEAVLAPPRAQSRVGREPHKQVLAIKRQWDQPRRDEAQASARGALHEGDERRDHARPAAFKGTEVDPERPKRMEQLCQIVEGFAARRSRRADVAGRHPRGPTPRSPGREYDWRAADDEARWRNAADEVRKAQASWRRLGPIPDAVAGSSTRVPESLQPVLQAARPAPAAVGAAAPLASGGCLVKPQTRVRSEIPREYKWDLSSIYPSWQAWEEAYVRLESLIAAFPNAGGPWRRAGRCSTRSWRWTSSASWRMRSGITLARA